MPRLALLLFAAVVAVLVAGARWAERTGPAFAALPATLAGQVEEGGGWYPGEPLLTTRPVRAWGTHTGNDDHRGTLALGPFPAPRRLQFAVGGYPTLPGNSLALELVASGERLPLRVAPDVGERWRLVAFDLPSAWQNRPVVLHAVDGASGPGGWLAVSEPIRGGRAAAHHAFLISLAGFAANAFLLALLALPALRWFAGRDLVAPAWQPLAAAAVVAVAAYLAFWAYFASAWLGHAVTALLILAALVHALRAPAFRFSDFPPSRVSFVHVALLMAAVGVFYLALLHLYPSPLSFDDLAGNRFRERLPSDNVLPFDLASRLHAGLSPTAPGAEWQSSDRPPLQSGWELLGWNATALLGLDARTASGTAAMWFQLLWIPAVYGLLRTLRLAPDRAVAWTAALSLSGFFLQNTVFTWPKLASAAFLLGAWAQWFASPAGPARRSDYAVGAALAALAWLAHGGVAFALLALAPAVIVACLRRPAAPRSALNSQLSTPPTRGWLLAALVFLAFATPWLAYQRLYEPPANRLLKWHLAGQDARDDRTLGETLRANYGALAWSEIADRKLANLRVQFAGNWRALGDFSARDASARRSDEFFFTFRTLAWWSFGAVFLGVALLRRSGRALLAPAARLHLGLAGWTVLTLLVWCALMFTGQQTVIHQGSYTTVLVLFVLLTVWCEAAASGLVVVVAALQAATLAANYGRANDVVAGVPAGLPVLALAALPLLALLALPFRASLTRAIRALLLPPAPAPDLAPPPARLPLRHLVGIVAVLAALLYLRKPDAVLTPQLWAEDGSIFLMQNDLHGTAALWMPYMGYLHTIPRLVAWTASHLLDPAWWPRFYHGVAFVLWVAIMARLFSSRLTLPGKPWLALAFLVAPHTGEVLVNITNLQWVTAFFLLQQVLVAAPKNRFERVFDVAAPLLVALTGPFGLVFLPLFAWRCWRTRRGFDVFVFAVLAAASATQAWFVARTGQRFDYQDAPFQLFTTLEVLARRLVAWPLLGQSTALDASAVLVGFGGCALLALLVVRAFRPDPHRALRLQVLAAFALITLAGLYRTRPDTWAADNLDYGDRYFYIPRVLLLWLLALEFDARPRWSAWLARGVAGLVALLQLPHYSLPQPIDYHWADHVEPIRRGVPGSLPTLPEGWTVDYQGRKK